MTNSLTKYLQRSAVVSLET